MNEISNFNLYATVLLLWPGAVEPYPELQSVVSTLSTGPVGPSDMVGGSNRDTIMRYISIIYASLH